MASLTLYGLGGVLALHGLVHLWYVVLSREWVEDDEGAGWNGESWLLSDVLPERVVLDIGSVLYVVVGVGFVAGGVGAAFATGWATPTLLGSALLSTGAIVIMWDGRVDRLTERGGVGVLVNAVVIGWLFVR